MPLPSQLPFYRSCRTVANRSNPIFAVPAVAGQQISVRITVTRTLIGCDTSCLPIRKDVSSNSVLVHNGNDNYGTSQRHNGTAERNGETVTTARQRKAGNQALVLIVCLCHIVTCHTHIVLSDQGLSSSCAVDHPLTTTTPSTGAAEGGNTMIHC